MTASQTWLFESLEKYNTVWEWPDRHRVVPMTFKVEDIDNMLSLLYPPVVKILLSCD